MPNQHRNDLISIWQAGVDSVQGAASVSAALELDSAYIPDQIMAVGKAAGSMCLGALQCLANDTPTLVVSPRDHVPGELQNFPGVTVIESSHPLPDRSSLDAGRALLDSVRSQASESKLLFLVSGGASALVEVLTEGRDLDELREQTDAWLASGLSIHAINKKRLELSRIKGGKLLREFSGAAIRVYAISDVRGDDIGVIGSGIGDDRLAQCPSETRVIASNETARVAAAQVAADLGYTVQLNEESLYGDVSEAASAIASRLINGEAGVYLWGGEPVVSLPANPGCGGRNQSLALSVALGIKDHDEISLLAAGTDGIDGTSEAAGGIVDAASVTDSADARRHLEAADAGSWLARHGADFVTGPTHSNVMDLVVAIVGVSSRA